MPAGMSSAASARSSATRSATISTSSVCSSGIVITAAVPSSEMAAGGTNGSPITSRFVNSKNFSLAPPTRDCFAGSKVPCSHSTCESVNLVSDLYTKTAAVASEPGRFSSALLTSAVSEVSDRPFVGAVSTVAARSGPKARAANIRPISRVTQAVFLPVMKLIRAFMFSPVSLRHKECP